nr:unnamed protein product [Spirometra erinaceieuropaei]
MAIPVPFIFVGNAILPTLLLLLRLLTVQQVVAWSLTEDGEPIKTTRLVSTKRFDMGGRVSASGVEIRFSDPRLPSVHALYGIRFASLGGSGPTTDASSAEAQRGTPAHSSRTDRKTNPLRPPAKRRFMHSVAAFIYETPQEGHLHKTTPPPVCPQPIPEVDAESANPRLKARLARLLPYLSNQSEDCLTLNVYTPQRDLRGRRIQSDEIMVSFDVTSLFKSIPPNVAREVLCKRLEEAYDDTQNALKIEHLMRLFEFCQQTFFTFAGETYEQIKGTPMGSPVSHLVTELVLQELEKIAFLQHEPVFWRSYVDDTFVIVKKDML